jgi:hypothetical protein
MLFTGAQWMASVVVRRWVWRRLTAERFWLNLQARYDLETEKDRLGAELDGIRPLGAAS